MLALRKAALPALAYRATLRGVRLLHSEPPRALYSKLFVPTSKDTPHDAELISHKLLHRAGFIRPVAAGLYMLLPMGLRVKDKLERIVDEELQRIGCNKLEMPLVLPKEMWVKSGRWDETAQEYFRLKDHRESQYLLAPTHEEPFTQLVAQSVTSYKQLPLRLYQIGRKYRDEMRPRGGLLRAREFIMKDLYTFDTNTEFARITYEQVAGAYHRIFQRLGLPVVQAEADSGNIGGSLTHEFHVVAQSGKDAVLKCSHCGYAANIERAHSRMPTGGGAKDWSKVPLQPTDVRNGLSPHDANTLLHRLISLADPAAQPYLKQQLVADQTSSSSSSDSLLRGVSPTVVVADDDFSTPYLIFLPEGREVNPYLAKDFLGADKVEVFTAGKGRCYLDDASLSWSGRVFLDDGLLPEGVDIDVICAKEKQSQTISGAAADHTAEQVAALKQVLGEKKADEVVRAGVRVVEIDEPIQGCFRMSAQGDRCGKNTCAGSLVEHKGIEVGHIFLLGDKYSKPFEANFKNEKGEVVTSEMGCYGLGVTRIIASVVEMSHDSKGLIWPESLSPYRLALIPLGPASASTHSAALQLSTLLQSRVASRLWGDVVIDDRVDRSAGNKLAEADLLGYSWIGVLGKQWEQSGKIELQERATGVKRLLTPEECVAFFSSGATHTAAVL